MCAKTLANLIPSQEFERRDLAERWHLVREAAAGSACSAGLKKPCGRKSGGGGVVPEPRVRTQQSKSAEKKNRIETQRNITAKRVRARVGENRDPSSILTESPFSLS